MFPPLLYEGALSQERLQPATILPLGLVTLRGPHLEVCLCTTSSRVSMEETLYC